MTVVLENYGVVITTGTVAPIVTTYFDPSGAQVTSIPNIAVVSANTVTTIDSFSTSTYRTAKYIVQVTNGTDYQSSEVLVVHNGTTATETTYAVINTGANLGVTSANIYLGNVKLNFTSPLSNSIVRIKKDYALI
jgi:hypothetical protein